MLHFGDANHVCAVLFSPSDLCHLCPQTCGQSLTFLDFLILSQSNLSPLSIALEALDLGSRPRFHGEMRDARRMAAEYAECEAWPSAPSEEELTERIWRETRMTLGRNKS